MRLVRIRRCVQCKEIRTLGLQVLFALAQEEIAELRLEAGDQGEFAILLDDQLVLESINEPLPTAQEVLRAVREEIAAIA